MTIYKLEPTTKPTDYVFLRGKTGRRDVRGEVEETVPLLFGRFSNLVESTAIDDMLNLDLEQGQDLFFQYSVIFELSGKKYIPGPKQLGSAKVVEYQKGSHLIAHLNPDYDLLARAHQTIELLHAMRTYKMEVDPDEADDTWDQILEAAAGAGFREIPEMSEVAKDEIEEQQMRDNFDIIHDVEAFVREYYLINSPTCNLAKDYPVTPIYHKGTAYPFYVNDHELFSQIGIEKIHAIMNSQPRDFFGKEKAPDDSGLIAIVKGEPEQILKKFS